MLTPFKVIDNELTLCQATILNKNKHNRSGQGAEKIKNILVNSTC